jgi:hypothetical protein
LDDNLNNRGATELIVLGWREWVGLPALGVDRIKVKCDTGARTSSLHAHRIRTFDRDGVSIVEFYMHPVQRQPEPEVLCQLPIYDLRSVASSNGRSEERIVVRTDVSICGQCWPIEITLTNRDEMGFRMLLGREALRERIVVDPASSFLGDGGDVPEDSIDSAEE